MIFREFEIVGETLLELCFVEERRRKSKEKKDVTKVVYFPTF